MNFIGDWFLEDVSVCDDIINFFNNSDYAKQNKTLGSVTEGVIPHKKDSIDLSIFSGNPLPDVCLEKYITQLQKVVELYIEKYPWCDKFASWSILEGFNIQYYKPGGGFKSYHTERVNANFPNATRHLVFQTFLNTVENGGETKFLHQKIKYKAEKGKTLIWPADWTHTHKGVVSSTEEKYIITGWFNYKNTFNPDDTNENDY